MTALDSPPVTVADRYRLVAPLGTGGMASVWEAVDLRLERPVAVKLLAAADAEVAVRCRAEARVLASLQHPNIVEVLDAGEHAGAPFVVTELVRGHTLRRRLAEGPLTPEVAARLGRQLAAALACAHRHHVVHRDLTPANVLLAEGTGDAKVIDFGIAISDHAAGLTATGQIIGTPAYLAPEQVEGRRATAAADVYSLGLVLLEAVSGSRPFPGGPTATALGRTLRDVPLPGDLPGGWTELLGPMTRRDPARRPTAEEVAVRLDALVATGGVAPAGVPAAEPTTVLAGPPPAPALEPARPPRSWPLVLAATALGLALAVVATVGANVAGGGDAPATSGTATRAADGPEAQVAPLDQLADVVVTPTASTTGPSAPSTTTAATTPAETSSSVTSTTGASSGAAEVTPAAAPGNGRGNGQANGYDRGRGPK